MSHTVSPGSTTCCALAGSCAGTAIGGARGAVAVASGLTCTAGADVAEVGALATAVGTGRVSSDGMYVGSDPAQDSGLITLGWIGYREAP